jgi:hypothetical protein
MRYIVGGPDWLAIKPITGGLVSSGSRGRLYWDFRDFAVRKKKLISMTEIPEMKKT